MAAFEDIVSVSERYLRTRPARAPDLARENAALMTLAGELTQQPDAVLQSLCDLIVEVCGAGSAGVSLLRPETEEFFWPAIAGAWTHLTGGTMPQSCSPCGYVLKHDIVLVSRDVTENFPAVAGATPPITEIMLAPFHVEGQAVGTVWVLSHDEHRFDAEDKRILINISRFAAAAYVLTQSREAARDAESRLRLLNRELSHRIKNTLSTVIAIADQTLRGRADKETASILQRRYQALATAQDILVKRESVSALLADVADGVLGKLGQASRIDQAGGPVSLGPRATLSLSLILHELGTNAIKYGALSNDLGRVCLRWGVVDARLEIEWHESGGPPVAPPVREGFGSQLIGMGLLGAGGATLDFAPDGLVARFSAVLTEIERQ